ncbi:MAG: DUF1778 domain-containing protein [Defluviicoccus sp.]|nr:DUF1778 domain-containing protein [Defluviicoccus sp.]MDE0277530.1 DUF1778 domain-containing protein [Defluviicoccus sp.]
MPVPERALQSQTINLRASVEQKTLIDRAAKRLGKSRSQFVLDTMREASENVLLDQRLFILDEAAFEAFEATLDAPAEPSEGLRRTLTTPPPWSE